MHCAIAAESTDPSIMELQDAINESLVEENETLKSLLTAYNRNNKFSVEEESAEFVCESMLKPKCFVFDTNAMIDHLGMFESTIVNKDVDIRVPLTVIHELDRNKKRTDVGWKVRQASRFLEKSIDDYKMQRNSSYSAIGKTGDCAILEYCTSLKERYVDVVLITSDINFATRAKNEKISVLKPD